MLNFKCKISLTLLLQGRLHKVCTGSKAYAEKISSLPQGSLQTLLQFSVFISNVIHLWKFIFADDICLSIQAQLLSGLNDILNAKLAKRHSR